jgi:signal peptidase II
MPWYILALLIMVLDMYTKAIASSALNYGEPLFVSTYLNWTLLHNTGAAFSFLSNAGGWQNGFFCVVAGAVSIIIAYWIYRSPVLVRWQVGAHSLALSMVLGGALGNLYDRLTLGYVVDFVQVHYQQYYFPAFNVADSAITAGAIMLVLLTIFISDTE